MNQITALVVQSIILQKCLLRDETNIERERWRLSPTNLSMAIYGLWVINKAGGLVYQKNFPGTQTY